MRVGTDDEEEEEGGSYKVTGCRGRGGGGAGRVGMIVFEPGELEPSIFVTRPKSSRRDAVTVLSSSTSTT